MNLYFAPLDTRDPWIAHEIHGLSREVRIHGLHNAIGGLHKSILCPQHIIYIYISRNTYFKNHKRPRSTVCMSCTSVLFVSCMYLDGGMGGGGWLLTSFFSIIYILGLVCYKHTIHVFIVYCVGRSKTPRVLYITYCYTWFTTTYRISGI